MRVIFTAEAALPAEARSGRPPLESAARRGANLVLSRHKVRRGGALNVIWCGGARVRALNRRFRGVNRLTDVISFRYGGDGAAVRDPFTAGRGAAARPPFGDLYISVPQARFNARRFGVTLREELVRLVVHGTLHLLGYTDYRPREKKIMWAAQEAALRRVLKTAGPARLPAGPRSARPRRA